MELRRIPDLTRVRLLLGVRLLLRIISLHLVPLPVRMGNIAMPTPAMPPHQGMVTLQHIVLPHQTHVVIVQE